MPEYTFINTEEIFEYDAAIVPEADYEVEYEYIQVDGNQMIESADQEIILEPVEPEQSSIQPSHERVSRKRSYKPVDELVRPGKKSKVPDSHLTEKQLISRNKRRARNREAAQRQRDRRLQKSALLEQKIEKLESENKDWEKKYKILEEKYQKLEFNLRIEKSKSIGQQRSANQITQNIGNGYQPAKLVQIHQRKRRNNLKVTIPTPVQPTVFAPVPVPVPPQVPAPVQTTAPVVTEESFCNLNEFIKIDTPTAKHVEKMALSAQDSFTFGLFDL